MRILTKDIRSIIVEGFKLSKEDYYHLDNEILRYIIKKSIEETNE